MIRKARILVFDAAVAEQIACVLRIFGYTVKTVHDFGGFLEEIKETQYDLLVLEVCDFYCRELADELQKLPSRVLFVTCGAEGHGFRLPTGEEHLIEKPFNWETFPSTIRRLLGEHAH